MIEKKIDKEELEKRIEERNWIEDKELLKLVVDKKYRKWTVAHSQAEHGWTTEDKEILMLADIDNWTVAHEQARNGWRTEDKEILKLVTEYGWTVAHEQARRGWTTNDKEILKLADWTGWTVAHEQAYRGWTTEDKEILMLAEKDGRTVAHIQASRGWITEDEEILKLTRENGWTVYDEIVYFWKKKSLNEINRNFSKLYFFILKAKEIGFTSITETQLYENIMKIVELKKMFINNISKRNKNNISKKTF